MQSLNLVFQQKEKAKKESTKERKEKEKYIYQLIPTGINSNNVSNSKDYDNDVLYQELSDLVNPSFRAWYCKKFYQLGKDKTLELASIARADGREPKKLFSYLLRGV